MRKLLNSKNIALASALFWAGTAALHAQVVSAGISGTVVNAEGKPVGGATVTVVHTPTNSTYKAVSSPAGYFHLSGLQVGGPYSVTATADGQPAGHLDDLETQLGQDIDVKITLGADAVQLEKVVVSGTSNALDGTALGGSSLFSKDRLEAKPTSQRSIADLISASPAITQRALSGDREEGMITALGQNNRYNSIMIDGNRINDQFGLNSTGLASFFNPLALDTIDQLSIQLSPYDARYSGFTGAAINAVTKSGTNEFHGSAYYIFSGDHYGKLQLQGPDERLLAATGTKFVPKLERITKGLTFGGPLVKDRVFFFLNWEKFHRVGAPNAAGLPTVTGSDLDKINARVAQIASGAYGALGGNANSVATDEKKLLKLDWRIVDGQKLSIRYSSTEGQVPQFGSFTTTSFGSGLNNTSAAALVGGAATAFDSHFYAQKRTEKSLSAQLISHWSSNLKSELKWSRVKQEQATPTATTLPEIDIFSVSGVNGSGAKVTNGVVVLGTERFRHGNAIKVDTNNYSGDVDYTLGNVTLSAGANVEANDYYNLFRQFSYGVFNYATVTDFVNDTPRFFQRNFTDLAIKGSYADVSQYTQAGVYGEASWAVTSRFNILGGIRFDRSSSNTRPVLNSQFLADTGMRNDGTVDGATDVSPRFGFNYSIDDERTTQLRGGAGYFVGRAPWVFWSNSYGNTGAGTYTVTALPSGGLTGYLANNFSAANPMGTGTQTGTARAEIDLADDKMHMPSLWRLDLAVDHRLSFLKSVVSAEIIHSVADNTLFISNDNLKVKGVAADGRTYFVGNPSTAANAKYANYTNIFHLQNKKAGESTYVTLSWDRPMKDKWAFDLSYSLGKSTEAQASGQTTASGAWQRNAVFNQGSVEVGTSDFEVKNRIQLSLARQFQFVKNWTTTAAIYYEGRTGSPYSFAYSNDMNQDGFAGNDLVSIPTSPDDARFDLTALNATQISDMFAFFEASGLSKYSGSYAPKNAFAQPWVNRLDFSIKQDIPVHFHDVKVTLFMDFTNLGSFISKSLFNDVERAPSSVNDVFDRRLVGNATIASDGKIKIATFSPTAFLIDNTMSRWRVQVGAKLTF